LRIPIEKIVVSKDNPRQSFDEEGLRRLGESILAHGQLQSVIVRSKGSQYELVIGERRLRACALVGINEIDAEVRKVDDATAMELRLIENTQREDLSDAEKGDAVLSLWANYDKYEKIKDVAKAINVPYDTVIGIWVAKAHKLSPKLRNVVGDISFSEEHSRYVLRYSHSVQERLADISIKHKLTKRQLLELTKLYDANPSTDLDKLANKVLGVVMVEVPKSMVSPVLQAQMDEKRQLDKVHRVRSKPSRPITKEDVQKQQKKSDFKFVKATVSHGKAGLLPPLKMEVKSTILPNPQAPDYTLCKCALCPLFATHCKGRCWT
jgi:ParB family chromosome partitioning protein